MFLETILENEYSPGLRTGSCVVQTQAAVGSKNCSVPLWIDAVEPAFRSRLWLGRSPACTHPSPTQKNQTLSQGAQVNKYTNRSHLMEILLMTIVKLTY